MSLLETRNRKFNLPIVFIIGVVFLVALSFFASYIESLSATTSGLKSPEVIRKQTENIVSLYIDENLVFYIDSDKVDSSQIETILKTRFENVDNPTIMLRIAQGVAVSNAMKIMDIGSKYQYKVVLKPVLK